MPRNPRRARRNGRVHGGPNLADLESLEGRVLLSYSTLDISLPDLTLSAFTAPGASWGGPLAVTLDVRNLGASSLPNPLATLPNASSSADTANAQPTTVAVFASPSKKSFRKEVLIGTITLPTIPENSVEQITQTLTLPSQPANFPGDGGTIFVRFQINPDRKILESDFTNDVSNTSPVRIVAPFPQIQAVALAVPPVMQPGDTIQPNIQIANLGVANTSPQGPFTVALVASVDKTFGPGDSVIALYQVASVPPISLVASQSPAFGEADLTPPSNVVTINGAPVTLPISPNTYFIGVVVDPSNQLKQLGKIGNVATDSTQFTLIQKVGPPIAGLPPAGVVTAGGGANNQLFPYSTTGVSVGNITPIAGISSVTHTPVPTMSAAQVRSRSIASLIVARRSRRG